MAAPGEAAGWKPAGTVSRTVSATTARVALSKTGSAGKVRVYATPTGAAAPPAEIFIKFGDVTVEAATTDMPLPVGMVEVLDAGEHAYIAAIAATGKDCTLYITGGDGD